MTEYMTVMYYKNTDTEEYEYFTSKKKAIEYAKRNTDSNTITSVWVNDEKYGNVMIWESE